MINHKKAIMTIILITTPVINAQTTAEDIIKMALLNFEWVKPHVG